MKNLKEPFKITLIYFVVGVVWILLSDRILLVFLSQKEILEFSYLQSIKGLIFVFVTALILYFLVNKYYNSFMSRVLDLEILNKQLNCQKEELENFTQNLIESDKRFSDLFNICPLPMWVFDQTSLKFLDVNIAALNLYGYSKSEFLEMTILDIRPVEDIDRVKKIVNQSFKDEFSVYKGIFRHIKKNQEEIRVRIKSNTISFKGENARLIVVNDLTELVQTQLDLKNAYDSIVKIEECERARFASELHDSFGQNLIAVKHFVTMLSVDCSTENNKKTYAILQEVIENLIKDCKEIIHDLRPKELYDGGLKNIIQSTCDRVNFLGELKVNFDLSNEIDENVELNIKFHLFRIFQENLNNTMKHSEATEAVVELAKRNNKIHFFFSDNGKGIDPKTLAAESSFLSLKRRVMSLGGTYDIQSDLGSGMVFYCKIPINYKLD